MAGQRDGVAAVATDTLQLRAGGADALQMRVRLTGRDDACPALRNAALVYSTAPAAQPEVANGDPALWSAALPVPGCSQMVYSDGGNVWCSPTSISMVLGYWANDPGPCEPRVRAAVAGVYDAVCHGHGNWAFNAAYAATRGTRRTYRASAVWPNSSPGCRRRAGRLQSASATAPASWPTRRLARLAATCRCWSASTLAATRS